jgi:hypothetical protein
MDAFIYMMHTQGVIQKNSGILWSIACLIAYILTCDVDGNSQNIKISQDVKGGPSTQPTAMKLLTMI